MVLLFMVAQQASHAEPRFTSSSRPARQIAGRRFGEMSAKELHEMQERNRKKARNGEMSAKELHEMQEPNRMTARRGEECWERVRSDGMRRQRSACPQILYNLPLAIVHERTLMREDAFAMWENLVFGQLESLSPATRTRILQLSANGKTPREIVKDFQDLDLAVATVEFVVEHPINQEPSAFARKSGTHSDPSNERKGCESETTAAKTPSPTLRRAHSEGTNKVADVRETEEDSLSKQHREELRLAANQEATRWAIKRCFKLAVGRSFKSLFRKTAASPSSKETLPKDGEKLSKGNLDQFVRLDSTHSSSSSSSSGDL